VLTCTSWVLWVSAATRNSPEPYKPPAWACSPGSVRNPLCPAPADGDERCDLVQCQPNAGCASATCNAVQGHIIADEILAVDAWFQRTSSCMKTSWSLAECCKLCQDTLECNAWSYCNRPDGCGSSCLPQLHNYQYTPSLNLWKLDPRDYPHRLNPDHTCLLNGQWPYQTCSLKKITRSLDVHDPPLEPGSKFTTVVKHIQQPQQMT
jgi:hypothetical protein